MEGPSSKRSWHGKTTRLRTRMFCKRNRGRSGKPKLCFPIWQFCRLNFNCRQIHWLSNYQLLSRLTKSSYTFDNWIKDDKKNYAFASTLVSSCHPSNKRLLPCKTWTDPNLFFLWFYNRDWRISKTICLCCGRDILTENRRFDRWILGRYYNSTQCRNHLYWIWLFLANKMQAHEGKSWE